jgi:alpha-amylase/alpha-mannosidase (GH57 family)
MRAEASDWFWWYFSEHNAPNKLDFDTLFRANLIKVYKILDEQIPNILLNPLWSDNDLEKFKQEKNITPSVMHKI